MGVEVEAVEDRHEPSEVVKLTAPGRGGARPGAGRKYGPAGKSAKNVRAAIASFVENSFEGVEALLGQVITGLPKLDANGEPIRDGEGSVIYVVKPAPAEAIKLMVDLAEFVVPKLSRSDVAVAAKMDTTITTTAENVGRIPTVELQARLLASLGLVNEDGTVKVQDVEARPVLVPLPSFLTGTDPQPLPSKSILALDTARMAAADLIRQHLPLDRQEDALADLDRRIGDIASRGG